MTAPKATQPTPTAATKKTIARSFVAWWFVVPCLLALAAIHVNFNSNGDANTDSNGNSRNLDAVVGQHHIAPRQQPKDEAQCKSRFDAILAAATTNSNGAIPKLQNASFIVHQNGQPDECGSIRDINLHDVLWDAYYYHHDCPTTITKYHLDSMLTKILHDHFMSDACSSTESDAAGIGLYHFCDMGISKTPILTDHDKLIPNYDSNQMVVLPCHFHSREGLRVTSLKGLLDMMHQDDEHEASHCGDDCTIQNNNNKWTAAQLYAVPAGRVFMFAPKYIGEIFQLPHVKGSDDQNIYLQVLNLQPRVFDVFHFFSRQESQELVDRSMQETRDAYRIKRSTTGASGHNVNSRRTSESGFDTSGATAMKVKRRCFAALGFDEYIESHADGLQILRYNLTTAYNSHLDWIEDETKQLEHDFESGGKGGNRFATILMYMTDLGPYDGGETVFPRAESNTTKDLAVAIDELRASEQGNVLRHGSWEESMTAKCRTKFAVRPHSSRAVLFYSQHPNGTVDQSSFHGACPILSGDKYAANLWVWNTPRQGYSEAPKRADYKNKNKSPSANDDNNNNAKHVKVTAVFENIGKDPNMREAKLYYQDTFWANLGPDDAPSSVNTYRGHVWNIKVNGQTVKSHVIDERNGINQRYEI